VEFVKEAVSLQAKLQQANARKKNTHRIVDKRKLGRDLFCMTPSEPKQTRLKRSRSKPRLRPVPALGSTPKRRTEKSVILRRSEKKKPVTNAMPLVANGVALSSPAIVIAEPTNPPN
jgi:hypothetical protein